MKINFRPIELSYGLGCVPIRIVTHYQKLMYTCFRLLYTGSRSLNGVQNRAITRYALFVVWKLYTCRFATQQTEHFSFRNSSIYNQRLISEKCLFLRVTFSESKNRQLVHISAPSRPCTYVQKSAPCTPGFQVYAKRKLAGFADKAFSVDNARSQTRLSSFALAKLTAVR